MSKLSKTFLELMIYLRVGISSCIWLRINWNLSYMILLTWSSSKYSVPICNCRCCFSSLYFSIQYSFCWLSHSRFYTRSLSRSISLTSSYDKLSELKELSLLCATFDCIFFNFIEGFSMYKLEWFDIIGDGISVYTSLSTMTI